MSNFPVRRQASPEFGQNHQNHPAGASFAKQNFALQSVPMPNQQQVLRSSDNALHIVQQKPGVIPTGASQNDGQQIVENQGQNRDDDSNYLNGVHLLNCSIDTSKEQFHWDQLDSDDEAE